MDGFRKGDLVRWVTGHSAYAAYPDRLEGTCPIFKYGIVLQVSKKDPRSIIVHAYGDSTSTKLAILDGSVDEIEVLSKGVENG